MLTPIFVVWVAIIMFMSCIWLIYRLIDNPAIVDTGWALALVLAGLLYLSFGLWTMRDTLLACVLVAWGLRLGSFLFTTRILRGERDKRYDDIADAWQYSKALGYFLNFQLQGVFIMLISTSFYVMAVEFKPEPGFVGYVGILIALVSLLCETVADLQLYDFKKKPDGKVCRVGFWAYSRHPNYFFEWAIWLGFAITTFDSWFGLVSIVSPLTLYMIMNYLTIPITERRSLASRGQAYAEYQAEVSKFWPMLPSQTAR